MIGDAYTWLENRAPQMLADLMELANQNSGSDNLSGLLGVADWLEDWMDLRGCDFQRIHLPPRRSVADDGSVVALETGPALRWDLHPRSERRVLLAIHYDTVFGSDHAFQACERIENDKLRGPGVADAKGGIVVLRYALQSLIEFALVNECGVSVILNPDEEVGSPSSTRLFQDVAPEFDFGLLFEPALPSEELVSTRKGSGNFDIVVRGKSAHAGRHFEDGRNAVVALSRLLVEIDRLNGCRDGTTINVGRTMGGGPVNIVPDTAVGRLNVRVADTSSAHWFTTELQRLVSEVDQMDGIRCELHGDISSPPKQMTPELEQLTRAVELASESVAAGHVKWKSTGGVCDGNKLAAVGLPNVDTMGPIGDGLHSSQEWVQPSSLVRKAKVVVNLIHRFATGEFGELQRQRLVEP